MRVTALALGLALVIGCSPSRACTPGMSAACVCTDGHTGAQVCAMDGSGFGACICSGSDAGMPVDAGPRPDDCTATMMCPTGQVCLSDGAGHSFCHVTCTNTNGCPDAAGCCVRQSDGTAACFDPTGRQCLCAQHNDCARLTGHGTPACAPRTSSGVVQHDYVCVPDDFAPDDGCFTGPCGNDCWGDAAGNQFCGHGCATNADCGNPGVACCAMPPTVSCHNIVEPCTTAGVCVPCP